MNNIKNSNLYLRKGFTLMELIVVVIIISVLASVAMPRYVGTIERSRAAEGVSLLGTLRSAQERHFLENQAYTDTLTDLDVTLPTLQNWTANISDTCCNTEASTCARLVRRINLATHYTLEIRCDSQIICSEGGTITCKQAGF